MSHRDARRDAEFSTFMEQAGPTLLRTAWLLTADHHQAQELAQAALVKTYVAWPRVRPGEAVAYARRVLVNHRTDAWRSTRREVPHEVPPERGTPDRSPEGAVDDCDEVVRLLRRLPEQQRKVVVLRYYADQSEAATADLLGITVGAVKSAASRGLASLRAGLAAETAAPPTTADEHSEEGSRR